MIALSASFILFADYYEFTLIGYLIPAELIFYPAILLLVFNLICKVEATVSPDYANRTRSALDVIGAAGGVLFAIGLFGVTLAKTQDENVDMRILEAFIILFLFTLLLCITLSLAFNFTSYLMKKLKYYFK